MLVKIKIKMETTIIKKSEENIEKDLATNINPVFIAKITVITSYISEHYFPVKQSHLFRDEREY